MFIIASIFSMTFILHFEFVILYSLSWKEASSDLSKHEATLPSMYSVAIEKAAWALIGQKGCRNGRCSSTVHDADVLAWWVQKTQRG